MSDDSQQLLAWLQSLPPEQRAQLLAQYTQQSGGVNLDAGNTIQQVGDVLAESQTKGAVENPGTLHGNAVGVNYGTVQAFFGGKPPADAKELLDNYLEWLVTEYGRLRLGKLLGKEQTGREQSALPALSLRAVYTALATNVRLPLKRFTDLTRDVLLETMDAGDPHQVLPDLVRLPILSVPERAELGLPASPLPPFVPLPSTEPLASQWAALRREAEQRRDGPLMGGWYRPELPINAIGAHRRLVLLGGPGSGKSTVLRYLTVWISEVLLAGRDPKKPSLPVPFFCQLGKVAQALSDDPAHDLEALISALMAPVVGAGGLRAELRETILQAWRRGGALLCLDGLDEVSGVPEHTRAGARSRRERLADAIRQLAGQLSRAWFVVTCRTKPYEQSAAWQLRDGWELRRLEPFTLGQVRHFVPAWYAQTCTASNALYTPAEAQARAEHLVEVLAQRPNLQEITASPLLLTMLVLLHYNKKQLPEERAEIYEELVGLLLDRWEGVRSADIDRRVATIGERLELPQLTIDDLRPAIHEIAFAAHQQAIDGRGVLTGEAMRRALDAFFARKINAADPRAVPRAVCAAKSDTLITLLREETGLVQEEGDDAYVLPHLTFEEYLAACHLAGREDIGLAYAQWRDGGDRWREVLLLLMGRLRKQEKFALAFSWLTLLVSERVGTMQKATLQRQRDAIFAAACYEALERRDHLAGRAHDVLGFEAQLRTALCDLLEHPDPTLTLPERVEAGRALGELGDPRFPVAIEQWRAEALLQIFGQPGGYWCSLPAGRYRIGEGGDDQSISVSGVVRSVARRLSGSTEAGVPIELPGFWIARYPVTVAQYAPFVAVGYGPEAERWWTPEGWRWKQSRQRSRPEDWDNSRYTATNQPVISVAWYEATAYCAWLSEQLVEVLPADYCVRLPSEAEWEAAASYAPGEPRRAYPWGEEDPTPERAIYDASGLDTPAPVGCCPAGAAVCGALDLAGNVWEWCASSLKAYPAQSQVLEKDFTLDSREYDVPLRGGSYYNNSTSVRCGARSRSDPIDRSGDDGFRLVVAPRSH
ncbi:MAG: SUMF1/EgtB/PvdO family nonheme iron enzyme [Kouleothrix sp.]|jgi:formylglycine-generating enzyme required for sulfatase activity|nr:SUMF1/EgtB/PvdO family nonheme iron enzyme [Kouleothrix sp.]